MELSITLTPIEAGGTYNAAWKQILSQFVREATRAAKKSHHQLLQSPSWPHYYFKPRDFILRPNSTDA